MECPKCSGDSFIKAGKQRGLQRYLCKPCHYFYTVTLKSTAKPYETKRLALQLYLEGLGFRSIGRLLKVSNVAILKWIRAFGKNLELARKEDPQKEVDIIEMDEVHTYLQSKKRFAGSGWLLIGLGRNSSRLCWAAEEPKRAKSSGKR